MHMVFSLQVTIRASLTGKTPTLATSPDQSGFIVSPETLSFNPQTKPPVSISKFKSNISGVGKAKTTPSKKQDSRNTPKHNLALRNLRLCFFTQQSKFSLKKENSLLIQTDFLFLKVFSTFRSVTAFCLINYLK